MTAAEAKRLAEANEASVTTILKEIEKAAKQGKLEMWWYFIIQDGQRKKLEELGYNVGTTSFERNEHLTKISWAFEIAIEKDAMGRRYTGYKDKNRDKIYEGDAIQWGVHAGIVSEYEPGLWVFGEKNLGLFPCCLEAEIIK